MARRSRNREMPNLFIIGAGKCGTSSLHSYLDLHPEIQAKVSGVPILDCHYGTSNGRYALKIDQLLTSTTRGWLGDSHVA